MSVEWMNLQDQYIMTKQEKDKAGYIWDAAIVECFLKNMVDVWETRNQDVHGKNKTEKQHRRKRKLSKRCIQQKETKQGKVHAPQKCSAAEYHPIHLITDRLI